MVPKGFYRAKALANTAQFGVTPAKGTDFIRIQFQITDGEFAGQSLAWDGYFTGEATKRTVDSLQYAGCTFPGNDITNLEGLGTTEVSIDVEHESYEKDGQAKTYAKVAWVNSLHRGVSPELQMNAGQKESFKQRMMGQLVVAKQAKPGVASPSGSAPQSQATGTGDKIPF